MRRRCFTTLLCSLLWAGGASGALPESEATPPAYQLLRFDEDYSCLADPDWRIEPLDQIKYIPLLAAHPDWYGTLGGELRERFEGNYNPGFGRHDAEPASTWLQRVTLLADVHAGRHLRFFAEGISGASVGGASPAPKVQNDPADLQFAFVDLIPYTTDTERWFIRGGRFGMSLGASRLVATRAAPNIPFRFDGVETSYHSPQWEATLFGVHPVKDVGGIASYDAGVAFWGAYFTHWFDPVKHLGADVYYFGYKNHDAHFAAGTAAETRHSVGSRFMGNSRGWDWNLEGVLQTGTFGADDILAWTASADVGHTWPIRTQPRLGLKVDVVSGDRNPADGRLETFNALYFRSGYFNDASLIRPANLIDVHPSLTVKPTAKVNLSGGGDVFWRYTTADAVYAPPGNIVVPANPADPWTLERALNEVPQLRMMRDEDETVAELLAIGRKLEGLYRHASTHAAGIVIG